MIAPPQHTPFGIEQVSSTRTYSAFLSVKSELTHDAQYMAAWFTVSGYPQRRDKAGDQVVILSSLLACEVGKKPHRSEGFKPTEVF